MAYEAGDLKVFNPSKEIATNVTLEIILRHSTAFKQARTGELQGIPLENISPNSRKLNQVKALNLIISAQREMITHSRPVISHRSHHDWNKKYTTDEEKREHPFEKEDNDYNKLLFWLSFLKSCENEIIKAEKTKRIDDDFIIKRQSNEGEVVELTRNFYEMLDELEGSYEHIYLLMLVNKIVSAGMEEDEELTYQEKEKEAMRRIVEA